MSSELIKTGFIDRLHRRPAKVRRRLLYLFMSFSIVIVFGFWITTMALTYDLDETTVVRTQGSAGDDLRLFMLNIKEAFRSR